MEKYAFITTLGRGGMADVHLVSAHGPAGFSKLLVVKELKPELAQDAEFVEMFLNEARLAARLQHPEVVQTYEVTRSGHQFFLAMEYLDGQPLHRVLSRLGSDNPALKRLYLRSIIEVLSGLHYAHELQDYNGSPLGIVHRDVSPHNLFVLYSGHVKLVDFGIAKVSGATLDTRSGVVKGKAAYMAPEQATARVTDRRADIYSCGVMLWEALAGRRMWSGIDEISIIGRLLTGTIPQLEEVNPSVPARLRAICEKALALAPEDRYGTAEAMRTDLLSASQDIGPLMSLEEFGILVASHFADERSKLQKLIHEHMDTVRESKRSANLAVAAAAGSDPTQLTFESSAAPTMRYVTQRTNTDPEGRKRPRHRWLLLALAAGAVSLLPFMLTQQEPNPLPASSAGATLQERPNVAEPRGSCDATGKPTVELTGEIENNARLSCDKNYLLKFNVFVLPGKTLTIEKGTTIFGDSATHAALVVQPGGRLFAEGTSSEPIVFTSARAPGEQAPGDWGGIVILGRAPTNLTDEHGQKKTSQVEGITFGGEYGGDDPEDSSGIIRYVRIEYPGNELGPGNELNGLTMAGVGRGTTIDHVQVRQASDDCFEFFGGTVNAKYLLCQGSGDDGFDWDYGYTGLLQFLILQQRPTSEGGDNGFEGDNDPNGSQNEPRSAPTIYNATLCGLNQKTAKESYGLLARRGTHAKIANTIVTGFPAGLDLRDLGTEVSIRSSIISGNSLHDVAFPELERGVAAYRDDDHDLNEVALFTEERSNSTESPRLIDCYNPLNPNFAPRRVLTAKVSTPSSEVFFDAVDFIGAVRDEDDSWYRQPWARWSDR